MAEAGHWVRSWYDRLTLEAEVGDLYARITSLQASRCHRDAGAQVLPTGSQQKQKAIRAPGDDSGALQEGVCHCQAPIDGQGSPHHSQRTLTPECLLWVLLLQHEVYLSRGKLLHRPDSCAQLSKLGLFTDQPR